MLPKKHRLVKKKDCEKVWRYGRSFFKEEIGFKALKNNLSISRFGFVVGTKVSKKAVQRNKIKRQLREIIRLKIKSIKTGYDFLIIALPKILEKNYWEINEIVEISLKEKGFLIKRN